MELLMKLPAPGFVMATIGPWVSKRMPGVSDAVTICPDAARYCTDTCLTPSPLDNVNGTLAAIGLNGTPTKPAASATRYSMALRQESAKVMVACSVEVAPLATLTLGLISGACASKL